MKKIITEWKFDKLFDACEKGLGTKDEEGNLIMTPEENKEWFRRIEELEEYVVIGPRVLINKIKDKIHDYKLKHLSLGKVKFNGKSIDEGEIKITNIPFNLTWQTDIYLLVIIRDYLRNFIDRSPAIGNCVFKKDELNPKCKKYYHVDNEKKAEEWKKLVNDVANEFDDLYKMQNHRFEAWDEAEWQKLKIKAFKDLAFIIDDLNW